MKKIILLSVACMLITACKGNPETTSGDSTGTGSGGARVPGTVTKDTTKQDTTGKGKIDTTVKQ